MNYDNLKIPNHVGIIVDGNGRWATSQGLKRSAGHKKGAENLEKLVLYILSKGIKVVSLYVFSTENFKRSEEEVGYLMKLFIEKFKTTVKKYNKSNIKVLFSGRREPLSTEILSAMDEMVEMTKNNTGGTVNFCLNYGGHAEIIDASIKLHNDLNNGKISISDINEDLYLKYMYNDLPMIDLLIRTGGEQRISNFMLWQISYSELYFTDVLWPDFNSLELEKALIDFEKRERRFGKEHT